ncbi:uncharacterized protein BDZ99DRAFT_465535 [Mytilinidion resinicola]|uniref:Uncharacterized protein n=1 Tax=Mytilinidion resinicola TaxID=574789 RepID=A0A6A6YDR5_9PEZI|nr:uncharacterized protein BDZ99DRAFT_465535 [Mytilinidion resinicola]KAF2806739.1 hypothetical protein BDZ99DRAFT_465535 [Mytilinidion resinicola]
MATATHTCPLRGLGKAHGHGSCIKSKIIPPHCVRHYCMRHQWPCPACGRLFKRSHGRCKACQTKKSLIWIRGYGVIR